MTVEKHALELAATLEERIARSGDIVLGVTDSALVARALRLLAAAAAEISGDRPRNAEALPRSRGLPMEGDGLLKAIAHEDH